jgi:hypothetical protein
LISQLYKFRKEKYMKQVPKARQLFRGDINDAVIRVQQTTGVNIDPAWWNNNVGNNGTTEQILDRFDKAYEKFLKEKQPGEYQ